MSSDSQTLSPVSLPWFNTPWTRSHWIGVLVAAICAGLFLLLQIALLSGWHFPHASTKLPIAPANATVTELRDGADMTLQFQTGAGPAVATTATMNTESSRTLGLLFKFDQIPANAAISAAWVNTKDRRKPTNVALALPVSITPREVYVPLRGHPEWRDTIAQIIVAVNAPPGSVVTLRNAEYVSATPLGAITHAWGVWSARTGDLRSSALSERVLPLWMLIAVAAAASFAWITRTTFDRFTRRTKLIGATTAFAAAAFASLLAGHWHVVSPLIGDVGPWWLTIIALALAFLSASELWKRNLARHVALAGALAAAVAAFLVGGYSFIWLVFAIAVFALFPQMNARFPRSRGFLFALPAISMAAVVQASGAKWPGVPEFKLVDPTGNLVSSTSSVGGFAALPLVLLLAYAFWPRSAGEQRNPRFAITLWLLLLGVVAVLASLRGPSGTSALAAVSLWLTLSLLTWAWLAPKFLSPISAELVEDHTGRTEADLSQNARQLFDAAAQSVERALASKETGRAHAPLLRMKELAPASVATQLATLRYNAVAGRIGEANAAYRLLLKQPEASLDAFANDTLADYANTINDFDALVALAPKLPTTEPNAKRLARAELLRAASMNDGVSAALTALQAVPEPNNLAHEIAELHLLRGDWQAAQQALIKSSFTPESIPGQVYVSRLGWLATQGAPMYSDQSQKLATWQNTLGVAQLGYGELLLRQGNTGGARARFLLARKLDPSLWAVERRIADIDRASEDAGSATDSAT